jgi:DNA-binding transcriptional regulator YiaG
MKKYRSDALGALHETVEGLHNAGLLDKQTMRDETTLGKANRSGQKACRRQSSGICKLS